MCSGAWISTIPVSQKTDQTVKIRGSRAYKHVNSKDIAGGVISDVLLVTVFVLDAGGLVVGRSPTSMV